MTNPSSNNNNNNNTSNKPQYIKPIPHSCGDICGKYLSMSAKNWLNNTNKVDEELIMDCKHKCVQLCHPGPCAPCEAMVTRSCNCGKVQFQVKCNSTKKPFCDKKCSNLLDCKLHECSQVCHAGQCEPCDVTIEQTCYSHLSKRMAKCGSAPKYNCAEKCRKTLNCSKHECAEMCHDGPCPPCALLPSKLTHCPCGRTPMRELLIKNKLIRTQCTDAIPTCEHVCARLLHEHDKMVHTCESKCHTGECPQCTRIIEIKCRCGRESEHIECHKASTIEKRCTRRCHKKKSCGRHQCNEQCCDDTDHTCIQLCNKMLNCGLHRCEDLCHKGPCQRCLIASFDERICECGSTVQYPPIRCGAQPLECNKPCSREHNCLHPVNHSCHWEEQCPPCTYLTSKMCMGNHEVRHNIPCYVKDVSCGLKCGKQLPNCSHKCMKTCHKDNCTDENTICTQACERERPHCDHKCNAPCHGESPCPDTICQEVITAKRDALFATNVRNESSGFREFGKRIERDAFVSLD